MKIYFKAVLIVLIVFLIYGLLGPFLISEKNDVAVLAGFAIIIIAFPLTGILVRSTVRDIQRCLKYPKEKSDDEKTD